MPDVSVIIPTRNRASFLNAALESLARQTRNDLEVIVINDGGGQVDDVVGKWRDDLTICLHNLPRRLGAAAARNVGLSVATGQCLAFLDDDDLLLPRHFEVALNHLRSSRDDVVYTGCVVTQERVSPSESALKRLPTETASYEYEFDGAFLKVMNFMPIMTVLIGDRRRYPARFDDQLPCMSDWDYWLQLHLRHRARFCYVPVVTAVYQHSISPDRITAAANTRNFVVHYRQLTSERWPETSNEDVRQARRLLDETNVTAAEKVESGLALRPFWYERTLEKLYAAFRTASLR